MAALLGVTLLAGPSAWAQVVPGPVANGGTARQLVAPGLGVARDYPGPAYLMTAAARPTEFETQDKLWFQDGAWWALMVTASSELAVHELRPDHTWRPASAPLTRGPSAVGDIAAGPDGDVSVTFTRPDGLAFAQLAYDAIERTYVHDPASVVLVTTDSGRTAAIDTDSTGRLWIAYVTDAEVLVTSSSDRGATWRTPAAPPVGQTDLDAGEIAAVIAFDQSVAVMWSDQRRSRFSFAVHRDDAPLDQWSLETALEGEELVDDHINLKVAPGPDGSTVLAAVKTSFDDVVAQPDAPLMLVLARSPSGRWTSHQAGTVADTQNRASLVVDDSSGSVHFVSHAPGNGGAVHLKTASLDDLSFPTGRGEVLMSGDGRLGDVTTPDHNVTSRTGAVVLAGNRDLQTYHHAEVAITSTDPVPVPADGVRPPPPEDLRGDAGPGSVALTWSASVDLTRWAPAAEGRVAADYVVFRDGAPLASVDRPYFQDRPVGVGPFAYSVAAVDDSGRRSPWTPPVLAQPQEAAAGSRWVQHALLAGLTVAIGSAVTVAVARRSRQAAR